MPWNFRLYPAKNSEHKRKCEQKEVSGGSFCTKYSGKTSESDLTGITEEENAEHASLENSELLSLHASAATT